MSAIRKSKSLGLVKGIAKSITKSFKSLTFKGCVGCGNPKLSEVVEPTTPIPKPENYRRNSENMAVGTIIKTGDRLSVVMESNYPFNDFMNSMYDMVLHEGIYSKDGLEELLYCFLKTNPPSLYDVIIEAFTEVWHRLMSDEKIRESILENQPLKRKGDTVAHKAESHELATGAGYVGTNSIIRQKLKDKQKGIMLGLQTPVSNADTSNSIRQKLKDKQKMGPQTYVGSPAGNHFTPVGPCRYDSLLGLSRKKKEKGFSGIWVMPNKEDFKVYNSLTQRKEVFKPHVDGKVGMYVCGVTAYNFSHLGHARAAVAFDVLYRYLLHLGYEVNYVRNFTDVDDKIIKRANETRENPLDLSNRFCQEYITDMTNLGCLLPTHQPRVSDHMEQIKDMISQIIKNDSAYVVDGDVFFSVEKMPDYGKLSGQKLENHRAGERVAVDSRKRNAADFALWKAAKPGEPSWESEWGPGRPGWHIECSAMSAHYLSFKFDIHGDGIDLIFPHHENERTQSCAACSESSVTYWMHNGHVTNDDEKMSKSLGNFFTVRQITDRYHPLALRHFLISAHYRSPLNYSVFQLEGSSVAIFYIYQTLKDTHDAISSFQEVNLREGAETKGKPVRMLPAAQECIDKLRSEFYGKMSDDLSTSHILTGAFQDCLEFMNNNLNTLKKKQQKQQQLLVLQSLIELEKEVKEVLDILGLLPCFLTYSEILEQLKGMALKRAGLV